LARRPGHDPKGLGLSADLLLWRPPSTSTIAVEVELISSAREPVVVDLAAARLALRRSSGEPAGQDVLGRCGCHSKECRATTETPNKRPSSLYRFGGAQRWIWS